MKKPPAKGAPISTKAQEPSVHPAIREIRVGRGYGVTVVPVVDFVLFREGSRLHILGAHGALCGNGRTKEVIRTSEACDPKAVMVEGKYVCARCRAMLGHVPMPHLVKDQGDE